MSRNLLPYDGETYYFGTIISSEDAEHDYETLLNTIDWRNDEAMMFGRRIITKRKVAWYGDIPFDYTYSKITKKALIWSEILLELKAMVEEKSGQKFNSCLLNLYHNGDEGMAYHSDDEKKPTMSLLERVEFFERSFSRNIFNKTKFRDAFMLTTQS